MNSANLPARMWDAHTAAVQRQAFGPPANTRQPTSTAKGVNMATTATRDYTFRSNSMRTQPENGEESDASNGSKDED